MNLEKFSSTENAWHNLNTLIYQAVGEALMQSTYNIKHFFLFYFIPSHRIASFHITKYKSINIIYPLPLNHSLHNLFTEEFRNANKLIKWQIFYCQYIEDCCAKEFRLITKEMKFSCQTKLNYFLGRSFLLT